MANIKELIQSIESPDSSFDEKLAAINQMEETLVAMQENEQQAIDDNVELIIEALKTIEAKVEAKLRIIPEKGEQGIQGQKGEQGDRGLDGAQGKDGKPGIDGKNGLDGKDGISVQDAKIDFDGSLVITLTDGREINVGEIVPIDVAQTIHKIQSGSGGDSQTTLNAIAALQATIATYGTMALQNANNVAITGGTIDNTVIGGTTPAAGTFTTLTATGQTSLGGVANSESLRVNPVASAVNWVEVTGGASGSSPTVKAAGAGRPLVLSGGSGSNGVNFYSNNLATQQFQVAHTATAVNYVQVTGAATTNDAKISAQGSDASIGMSYSSKNGYFHRFWTNNFADQQFAVIHTASSANYATAKGSATGFGVVFSAQGSDTNIPVVVQPKGTGALQAQQTDSTATGGNARGANAVDWQTSRGAASSVASGSYAVISGGSGNTNTGTYGSLVGGLNNTASGLAAFIGSGQGVTATRDYSVGVGGISNNSTGYFNFIGGGQGNSGTANAAVTTQSSTMNGTTAVTLAASNANIKVGQVIQGTSINNYTYVAAISGTSLTLSQAASGSSTSTLSFYTPHGVVVGGGNNQATGSYSFIGGGGDAGTAANRNVASGDYSTVVGGRSNQATGIASFVGGGGFYGTGGNGNVASGIGSVVVGGWGNQVTNTGGAVLGGAYNIATGQYGSILSGQLGASRSLLGYSVFSAVNPFSSTQGGSQAGIIVLAKQTTDATPSVLTSDGTAASGINQVILPNNSAYYFRGEVVAGVTGGGNTKGWFIEGVIKRGANAASTALVGTPTVTSSYADAGASTWTIAVTADTTNGGLAVTFTGQAGTTIRTVAQIRTTEMTY